MDHKNTLYVTLACIFLSNCLFSQAFTEVTGANLPGVYTGAVAFADIDGDDDQDLLITGFSISTGRLTRLYKNDGTGNFTQVSAPATGIHKSSVAFADLDNDGDQDLVLSGRTNVANYTSVLCINDGTGDFTQMPAPFEDLGYGSISIADIDNDGDQDVLITGTSDTGSSTGVTRLYTNDGVGNFTEVVSTPFEDVYDSSVTFVDIDGDNDQDIIISGQSNLSGTITKLYRNDGAGNFQQITAPFEDVRFGSVATADIDGDNDQDVLITGRGDFGNAVATLYKNDGTGDFQEITTPFQGVIYSDAAFSDIDNDGDQDVLITGGMSSSSSPTSKLYINDGTGSFQEVTTSLSAVEYSSIAFADVDGDNDQDVLITGAINSGFTSIAKLYKNDLITAVINPVEEVTKATLYPNPAISNQVYIEYTSESESNVQLSLMDSNGKILLQQNTAVNYGLNKIVFNYPDLSKGLYLIQLKDGDDSHYLKLLIQ